MICFLPLIMEMEWTVEKLPVPSVPSTLYFPCTRAVPFARANGCYPSFIQIESQNARTHPRCHHDSMPFTTFIATSVYMAFIWFDYFLQSLVENQNDLTPKLPTSIKCIQRYLMRSQWLVCLGQCTLNPFKIKLTCSIIFQIKGRMGAAESTPSKETQLRSIETTPLACFSEHPLETDPLRHFLSQRTYQEAKVKTLTDIQKEADKLKPSRNLSHATCPPPMSSHSHSFTNTQPKNEQNQPSATLSNNKESKQNISPDLQSNSIKKQVSPSKRSSLNNTFKAISIDTESFIKVREESPLIYYQLKEMIGEGSYGQVFKAQNRNTGEIKAIKVLKGNKLKQAGVRVFLAQVTLQSRLNHPSIVSLCDLFHHNHLYYVVMEYCDGGSVVQLINKISPKSEVIIANIMRQLLRALSYLHSLCIIHRDIKLQNIVFLKGDDSDCIPIKIIDFGAAVKSEIRVVQKYPIAGTLTYLAPEAMKGVLTNKSDMWSTGVLMHLLLTGVSPFKGKNEAETKQFVLNKELNYNAYPLSHLSECAKDLLRKLLDRSIYKRISANQALAHPWLSQRQLSHQISMTSLENLQSHYRGNNLVSIIESYLSLRKVTQQERQRLARIFTGIDKDGNGLIEKEELVHILKAQNEHFSRLSQAAIEQLVGEIDQNRSGKIDFNEFIIAMYDKDKLYVQESLNEAFEHLDRDHTGFIELDELKAILQGGDAAEAEYFISMIDLDKDRKISREEFISYLLNF